jgi:hypothetical protein
MTLEAVEQKKGIQNNELHTELLIGVIKTNY